jgi:hypothetical protein
MELHEATVSVASMGLAFLLAVSTVDTHVVRLICRTALACLMPRLLALFVVWDPLDMVSLSARVGVRFVRCPWFLSYRVL